MTLYVKWEMSLGDRYSHYDEHGPAIDVGEGIVVGTVHVRDRDEYTGTDHFIVLRTDGGGEYKRGPYDRVPINSCTWSKWTENSASSSTSFVPKHKEKKP